MRRMANREKSISDCLRALLCSAAAIGAGLVEAAGEDWPGFRGSTGDGVSGETDLPLHWGGENGIGLRWRTELEGRGNSSPVVVGNRLYLTSRRKEDGNSLWLHSFDTADGSLAWEEKVTSGALPARAPFGLYGSDHDAATPTPVANADLVSALFGTGELVCFDRDGRELWRRNLFDDFGELDINFGIGASPRLWDGIIYLSCLSKGPTYVLAIDARTGRDIWKTERDFPARVDAEDSYLTPAIWSPVGSDPLLLVAGADRLNSYSLKTGEQRWVCAGFDINADTGRIIASPAFSGETILQCSGNPRGNGRAIALRAEGRTGGNITESNVLWRFERRTPDRPSPVIYQGKAYIVRDNGVAYCLDVASGEIHWQERLAGGKYYPSVIAGDFRVYFHNMRGITTVIEAGEVYRKLAENAVPGRSFNATPAISGGSIYLRSYDALIAVGESGAESRQ